MKRSAYFMPAVVGGNVDAGQCDPGFNIHVVTAGEADAFKARLDPLFDDTNAAVSACAAKLGGPEVESWLGFYGEWKTFAATPSSWWTANGDGRNACAHAAQLDAWRTKLKEAGCVIPGPETIDPHNRDPLEQIATLLKWAAVGGIAVGGTMLLLELAPLLRGMGKR